MSNNKQSSIEWVIGEIIKHQMTFYGTSSMPLRIIEQAKAKHKEEFVDFALFYTFGRTDMVAMRKYCEKLYDEKFNND